MNTSRARKPSTIIGVMAIVCGVAIAATCLVVLTTGFMKLVMGPVYSTPAAVERELRASKYLVYERTGTQRSSGSVTFSEFGSITLGAEQVSVTGPDGTRLPVRRPTTNETITRNTAVFSGAIEFRVKVPGRYRIEVRSERPTTVMVAESLGTSMMRALPMVLGMVGGGAVALAGIVVLAVSAARRNRSTANADATATTPSPALHRTGPGPGWYPTGQPGGEVGWWDGSAWTEHRSPV